LRLFGDYSYVKRDLRRIAILTISALVPALGVIVCLRLPAPAKRALSSTRSTSAVAPLAD
jgi:hypothetical protein